MKNTKMDFRFPIGIFRNFTITGVTALALIAGISTEVKAAKIEFDADTYAFSNPNTCTPQLPDTGGKCFIEDGFNVEAFSAQEIGSPTAFYSEGAHFHSRNSYEAQHFSEVDRLLGIYLTLPNGGTFSLQSLDYQLRDNTRAISGYSTDDTKILISTTFDPNQPVLGQFMEYSLGNDLPAMFQTLNLSEFEDITQVYIASSGDVNFDNITTNSIPESSTVVGLLTLGIIGLLSQIKGKSKINN
ncbi:MAG: PEP-CTERM sorting domain-containing protein [Crocosphaera sp.]|nr:PEP-CTERM sorting domain-containing protein [Crocosphaera sp.]